MFSANVKVTCFTSGLNAGRQTFSHLSCADDYLDFPREPAVPIAVPVAVPVLVA